MTYNKTTWAAGDTITAEKLNNIENGVEAASAALSYPTISITRNDPLLDRVPSIGMAMGSLIENNYQPVLRTPTERTTTFSFIPYYDSVYYQVQFTFPEVANYTVTSTTMTVELDSYDHWYYITYEDETYPGDLDLTIDYE